MIAGGFEFGAMSKTALVVVSILRFGETGEEHVALEFHSFNLCLLGLLLCVAGSCVDKSARSFWYPSYI